MERPDLAMIVPCYNEAARLKPQAFLEFISSHPTAWLLLVDDGSVDATPGMLGQLQAAAPDAIGVLRLAPHRGKGEAVRRGIQMALGRRPALVGFWDADLSTPLGA